MFVIFLIRKNSVVFLLKPGNAKSTKSRFLNPTRYKLCRYKASASLWQQKNSKSILNNFSILIDFTSSTTKKRKSNIHKLTITPTELKHIVY